MAAPSEPPLRGRTGAAAGLGDGVLADAGTVHHQDLGRPVCETLADENPPRYVGEDPTVASTLKLVSNYLLLTGMPACLRASPPPRQPILTTLSFR